MPKLTTRDELAHFSAPTLIIAGEEDIFFSENKVKKSAEQIVPNLIAFYSFNMGHFPSENQLQTINHTIQNFFEKYY